MPFFPRGSNRGIGFLLMIARVRELAPDRRACPFTDPFCSENIPPADLVKQRLMLEHALQIFEEYGLAACSHAGARVGRVWCEQYARVLPCPGVYIGWFAVEDIEDGVFGSPVIERLLQIGLYYQIATRDVYEY